MIVSDTVVCDTWPGPHSHLIAMISVSFRVSHFRRPNREKSSFFVYMSVIHVLEIENKDVNVVFDPPLCHGSRK